MTIHNNTSDADIAPFSTLKVSSSLNVQARLSDLRRWDREYMENDARLDDRLRRLHATSLQTGRPMDDQKGAQIKELRHRNRVIKIKVPLEIVSTPAGGEGYYQIRNALVPQFASLSNPDKLLWLNNFLFILTDDLWELLARIAVVRDEFSLGQQSGFLLAGQSGMGKSTILDMIAHHLSRVIEEEFTRVPVVKIVAPEATNAPTAIYYRLLAEFGVAYRSGEKMEFLRQRLQTNVQLCMTLLVIVDEIENLSGVKTAKQFVDINNALADIPMILASPNPENFLAMANSEALTGRFDDRMTLQPLSGTKLMTILAFIQLLLPFTQESTLLEGECVTFIEQATQGRFRDLMKLISRSCKRVIAADDLTHVNINVLRAAWSQVHNERVVV